MISHVDVYFERPTDDGFAFLQTSLPDMDTVATEGLSTEENIIAREVMYNHYTLKVGLIPLSETVHELVHNQYLFIPNDVVFGNWKAFIETYKDYIPLETISNIEKSEKMSQEYDYEDNTKILDHGFVHVQVDDSDYQPSTEKLYEKINTTLNEIKAKTDA